MAARRIICQELKTDPRGRQITRAEWEFMAGSPDVKITAIGEDGDKIHTNLSKSKMESWENILGMIDFMRAGGIIMKHEQAYDLLNAMMSGASHPHISGNTSPAFAQTAAPKPAPQLFERPPQPQRAVFGKRIPAADAP